MTTSGPPSVTAVVSNFPALSQTFILRKLLGLRDAGVHVTIASGVLEPGADRLGVDLVPLMPWGDPLHALDAPNRRAWQATVAGFRSLGRERHLPLKERLTYSPLLGSTSDIVHFEFSGIAVTYRGLLDRLAPAKLAVSCRGAAEQIVPLRDPARGPQLLEVFSAVDLIHCVSDDIRRTVESLGAPPERILVNRPAVPLAQFAPLAERRTVRAEHGPLRVLSVGRLHWKKGFDDALRALAIVRDRGRAFTYRIAGEGDEREKLSFLLEQLRLGDRVELLGSCSGDEVLEQLEWADVLLLPSLSEGISNAVLEAMASGLPVVVTESGGMREVVDDGADGLVVPVGDVEAIAESLCRLVEDHDLRDRLGRAAFQRAERDHGLDRQIGVFLEAYRALTA